MLALSRTVRKKRLLDFDSNKHSCLLTCEVHTECSVLEGVPYI